MAIPGLKVVAPSTPRRHGRPDGGRDPRSGPGDLLRAQGPVSRRRARCPTARSSTSSGRPGSSAQGPTSRSWRSRDGAPSARGGRTPGASDGISAEVIDVRSLVPLDTRTILESVGKTGPSVHGRGEPAAVRLGRRDRLDRRRGGLLEPRRSDRPHHDAAHPAARGRRARGSRDPVGRPHLRDGLQGARVRRRCVTTGFLLRGGCVLTLGAKSPNFTEADVLLVDGKVAEVGRGLRARDAEVVDAADTIVMPGFVDTHRHAWTSLFRNLGDGADREGDPVSSSVLGGYFAARRRLRRDADRAAGRAGGGDHHRGRLVGPAARRRVGRGRAPGACRRRAPHRVRLGCLGPDARGCGPSVPGGPHAPRGRRRPVDHDRARLGWVRSGRRRAGRRRLGART